MASLFLFALYLHFCKNTVLFAFHLHLNSTINPPENARNSKKHGQKPCFCWWEEVDSNYRSRRRQIYSLIHLAALESSRRAESTIYGVCCLFYVLNIENGVYQEFAICEKFAKVIYFLSVSWKIRLLVRRYSEYYRCENTFSWSFLCCYAPSSG